jgi:hypothetical protein
VKQDADLHRRQMADYTLSSVREQVFEDETAWEACPSLSPLQVDDQTKGGVGVRATQVSGVEVLCMAKFANQVLEQPAVLHSGNDSPPDPGNEKDEDG